MPCDSATIDEAVDLLECAGWKGYAHAVREQSQQLAAQAAQLETVRQENETLLARVATLEAADAPAGSSASSPEPSPSLPSGPDRSSFRAGYAFGFADRHDGQSSNPEYAWKRMFAIVTRGGTRTVGLQEAPRPVCTCRHDSGMSTDCAVHFPVSDNKKG